MRAHVAAIAAALTVLVGAAPVDRAAPRLWVATEQDSVLVSAPVDSPNTTVRGSVHDDVSGVRAVRVTYCPNAQRHETGWTCGSLAAGGVGGIVVNEATVSCRDRAQRHCHWAARLPTAPGRYVAIVEARDAVGRRSYARPLFITVV